LKKISGMTRNTETAMVVHTPAGRSNALVRQATQAATSAASKVVASMLYNSLPSAKTVGRVARETIDGYRASGRSSNNTASVGFGTSSAAPVAISTRVVSRRAKVSTKGRSGTNIKHRELVTSLIQGQTAFTLVSNLPINPGMAQLFPWLSVQAAQWQEYRFRRLMFEWVPIAPTSTQGDITLAVDYEASNPPPTTEVQMSDLHGAVTDSTWKPIRLGCNVKDMYALGPRKYVRSSVVNGDIKTFDSGNFYLAVENFSAGNVTAGKLYVTYDVDLFIPYNGPLQYTQPTASTEINRITTAQTIVTATPTVWIPDTALFNALGITVSFVNGNMTPAPGFYRVDWQFTIKDTQAETFTAVGQLNKNGAFQGAFSTDIVSNVANGVITLSASSLVSCNGTDVLTLLVTATGAAGTLTIVANSAYVIFSLA
jgi:hypothetical protein